MAKPVLAVFAAAEDAPVVVDIAVVAPVADPEDLAAEELEDGLKELL